MPKFTFDQAQERFAESPSTSTAGAYMAEAMRYEADDMIGDDTFQNALVDIRDWLTTPAIDHTPVLLAALKRCVDRLSEKRPKPRKPGGRRPLDFDLEMAIATAGKAIAAAEGRAP